MQILTQMHWKGPEIWFSNKLSGDGDFADSRLTL